MLAKRVWIEDASSELTIKPENGITSWVLYFILYICTRHERVNKESKYKYLAKRSLEGRHMIACAFLCDSINDDKEEPSNLYW